MTKIVGSETNLINQLNYTLYRRFIHCLDFLRLIGMYLNVAKNKIENESDSRIANFTCTYI